MDLMEVRTDLVLDHITSEETDLNYYQLNVQSNNDIVQLLKPVETEIKECLNSSARKSLTRYWTLYNTLNRTRVCKHRNKYLALCLARLYSKKELSVVFLERSLKPFMMV